LRGKHCHGASKRNSNGLDNSLFTSPSRP